MDGKMILHMILGLLLLVIPAGALFYFDKSLLRSFGVAVGRMFLQLLVLCLIVWGLIRVDAVWLSLLWLVLLSGLSAILVSRRAKLPLGQFALPVAVSLSLTALAVGLWLLLLVLPVQHAFGARWFVPVMALLVGHAMNTTVRGLSTYQSSLKADEQHYEFLRGNGTDHLHAVMPFVRRALQAVFAPTVANLSVMGLFAMPLLLCGILLGGHSPLQAFVLTLVLVFGCLAASALSLAMSLWLVDRQLFDKFGKLK